MATGKKAKAGKVAAAAAAPVVPAEERKLKVVMLAIGKLRAYERNARQHPKKQLEQIAESIRRYGFNAPVLIGADNTIIAGHGRVQAAEMAGLKRVPCISLAHLSDRERREYIIADNKIAEGGRWDDALLRLELAELNAAGAGDLKAIGFSAAELAKLAPNHKPGGGLDLPAEEAETPAPPARPVSRAGDLWLLGSHRLICGDSTEAATVERLLAGGAEPRLMITDPPYGVEYAPDWRNDTAALGQTGHGGATGKVSNDDRADWTPAWKLFKGAVAYVWHASLHAVPVVCSLETAGFELRAQIIWAKQAHVVSRGHYHWKHEPCWYAVRKGQTAGWRGARDQTTVWEIANAGAFGGKNEDGRTGHGTQKPVECMARPIVNHTDEGDAVYEPFSGSGTTIVAAEQLKRICYAVELDPAYVDVALRRWQNLTGQAATLDGDGRTFAEIEAERMAAAAAPRQRRAAPKPAAEDEAPAAA